MLTRRTKRVTGVALVAALAVVSAMFVAPAHQVLRRFAAYDGKTMKIGGIGLREPTSTPTHASARRRGSSASTTIMRSRASRSSTRTTSTTSRTRRSSALSVATRLVTQDGVFAIVPDLSRVQPGRLLQLAARPVLRLGVRRHVLQPDVDHQAVRLRLQRLPGAAEPEAWRVTPRSPAVQVREREDGQEEARPRALFSNETDSGKTAVVGPEHQLHRCRLRRHVREGPAAAAAAR